MGARRSLACPRCRAERVTKALGRQKISCNKCGHVFLAAQAEEFTQSPGAPAETGPSTGAPVTPSGLGMGNVTVLKPVRLKMSRGGLEKSPPPAGAPAQAPTAQEAVPIGQQGGGAASAPSPAPARAPLKSAPSGASSGEGGDDPTPPRRGPSPYHRPAA